MSSVNALADEFVTMCRKDMQDSFEDADSLDQVSNLARDTFVRFMAIHPVSGGKTKLKTRVSAKASAVPEATATPLKKVRKQKDPSAPRKLSGYNVFVNFTMKNHPDFSLPAKPLKEGDLAGIPSKERMKRCGSLWKELSDEQRGEWNTKALAQNVTSGAVKPAEPVADVVA